MAIKTAGGLPLKLVSPGVAGIPDRLILLPGGCVVFIEVKAPGKKLRPLQAKRHKQIAALGFRIFTIDSPEAIQEVFSQ